MVNCLYGNVFNSKYYDIICNDTRDEIGIKKWLLCRIHDDDNSKYNYTLYDSQNITSGCQNEQVAMLWSFYNVIAYRMFNLPVFPTNVSLVINAQIVGIWKFIGFFLKDFLYYTMP